MKKLPKAVLRTSAEMHATADALATPDRGATAETDLPRAGAKASSGADNVIELPAKGAAARPEPAAADPKDETHAAERRSRAMVIVERHATYAAVGGLI